MAACDECNTAISCKLGQLKHENDFLHSGTLPPSYQDRELKITYHLLNEVEHG
jgi:hypothetical protein